MTVEVPDVISETIEAEVRIDAAPDVVWRALTEQVGSWWPYRFNDDSVSVVLEPVVGGRFYEAFDENGAGALYATVTYLEPRRMLRVSGSMGLRGAASYVKIYELEPAGDGTIVRTSASMMGAIPEETRAGYRTGNQEVLDALRDHVHRR